MDRARIELIATAIHDLTDTAPDTIGAMQRLVQIVGEEQPTPTVAALRDVVLTLVTFTSLLGQLVIALGEEALDIGIGPVEQSDEP